MGELAEYDESTVEKSIVLALDGETHTLGNALRDVMWAHPHVQLASYTQEHPSSSEIILRCQTSGAISAEQGVVEALHMTKAILRHMGDSMGAAAQAWQQQQQRQKPGGTGGGGGAGGKCGSEQQQQQQQQQEEQQTGEEEEEDEEQGEGDDAEAMLEDDA